MCCDELRAPCTQFQIIWHAVSESVVRCPSSDSRPNHVRWRENKSKNLSTINIRRTIIRFTVGVVSLNSILPSKWLYFLSQPLWWRKVIEREAVISWMLFGPLSDTFFPIATVYSPALNSWISQTSFLYCGSQWVRLLLRTQVCQICSLYYPLYVWIQNCFISSYSFLIHILDSS